MGSTGRPPACGTRFWAGSDGSTRRLATPRELVSVVPGRAELWLVEACLGAAADIAGCEEQGLLVTDHDGIRFRHELARWVVEEALSGQQRREHNRAVLRALVAADAPDARLAHHAWRSGDDEAVVRHGLAAAHRAAESRSHREAAELFSRVIEHEEAACTPGPRRRPRLPVDRGLLRRSPRAGGVRPGARLDPAPRAWRPAPYRRHLALALPRAVVDRGPGRRRGGRSGGGGRARRRTTWPGAGDGTRATSPSWPC